MTHLFQHKHLLLYNVSLQSLVFPPIDVLYYKNKNKEKIVVVCLCFYTRCLYAVSLYIVTIYYLFDATV